MPAAERRLRHGTGGGVRVTPSAASGERGGDAMCIGFGAS